MFFAAVQSLQFDVVSVQQQLGLKLTAAQAPVPVLVIDSLVQPEAQ